MRVSDFDYALPEELIAQAPVEPRDASRLLVVARAGGPLEHARFPELTRLLRPGDLLVMNDTRVIPARLLGHKESGGRCELLLVEPLSSSGDDRSRWRAIGQASKPLRPGARLRFGTLAATVEAAEGEGFFTVAFDGPAEGFEAALEREGRLPLPPYIAREPTAQDRERYQTIVARAPGSAAAPTAGLHFTQPLLDALAEHGVGLATVTLHVGPGTFLPVRVEDLARHRMHEERYDVPASTAEAFARARARGGRIVAVGTTAVRTLESAFEGGDLRVGAGRTAIFIAPGYHFHAVDALVTNLHLPRSTLLMLACAFGGRERVLAAYAEAVARRYRFFSYGDAMFLA
jgi:S-adenosylmethionine:tRNA ribosyltransferase-isomerase